MFSFASKKCKKVWIFYAYAPETKEILAVTMGKRNQKQLQSLMVQIKNLHIEIGFYCTDRFEAFKEVLPYCKHLIGKKFTKNIEGVNTPIRSKIARFHRRTTARAAPQVFKEANYSMVFDENIHFLFQPNAIIHLRTYPWKDSNSNKTNILAQW